MWTNFFVVAAGASATLAGLVFVALSVNLNRILQSPNLPARAAGTLGALILILVTSMAVLIPQPRLPLGIEIVAFALFGWRLKLFSAKHQIAAQRENPRPHFETVLEIVGGQLQVLPFLVGGALLLIGRASGLYWVAAGSITIFVLSALSAWVFLVEIVR